MPEEPRGFKWNWRANIALLITVFLYVLSFQPFNIAEFGYFFAVPYLLWAVNNPKKHTLLRSGVLGFLCWFGLIFWLRNATWVGFLITALIMSPFISGWFYIAGRYLPKVLELKFLMRLLMLLGLAGFWVILEWLELYIFTGFQWAPLATTQVERPVMLQVLEWTGFYGLSFVLIFANLALLTWLHKLYERRKLKKGRVSLWGAQCPELLLVLGFILISAVHFNKSISAHREKDELFKVGVIQPNVKPEFKWKIEKFWQNLRIIKEESQKLAAEKPNFIIWPETSLPTAINRNLSIQNWISEIQKDIKAPIVFGALCNEYECWSDCIYTYDDNGVSKNYSKHKLVPFGEYVPFKSVFPFLTKVVPMNFDLRCARKGGPFKVNGKSREVLLGGLICYEDIFSELSRGHLNAGAEAFLVITNDGWYGEEAGAYQHMAASVLRAVECRRPVIRCGNNGWSGWIDEFGIRRCEVQDEKGSIYFCGGESFSVYRNKYWAGKKTFYARHGDWFVKASSGLMILAALLFVFIRENKKDV